jgi:hypothetical protein
MGGRNSDTGLGDWGQFDWSVNPDAKYTDAGIFSAGGGSEQQYQGMTPEERQQYLALVNRYHGSKNQADSDSAHADIKAFIGGLGSGHPSGQPGSGGGTMASTPNAGDPQVSNNYTQAATPNVTNPWGGQQWTQDPKTGQWTVNSGPTGQLADANYVLQTGFGHNLEKGLGTGDDARNQAVTAAYGQALSRLDPQWDKRQEAQRTQLLNQGLDPSSEAYKSAMQDFGLQRNDAYSSAMNNAISQGTQAGHTAFQDNLTAFNNPLQDMEQIKLLSAQQSHPELLNAYIAQQNAALKQRSDLMQQQTDLTGAGMNMAGNIIQGALS